MKVQFFRVGGVILGILTLLTACAKPPAYQQPISATPPTGN